MAFEFDLNKVKESLVSAGKEVGSMAKDASAIAKIKIDIHNKEIFLEKQYALLGKAFYNALSASVRSFRRFCIRCRGSCQVESP